MSADEAAVLQPQPVGIPVPRTSLVAAPYWDGCRAGELRFQRCASCGGVVFYPSHVCHACQSTELAWEVSVGEGELYSWTVVWRAQTPAFRVPYAPAIVAMDEGFWLLTSVVGCAPDDLRAGLRMRVEFHLAGDDLVLPYVAPA